MPRSYVDTLRRYRLVLAVPVLITVLIAGAFALLQPRSYVATATVFADNPIPTDTSVGTTGADKPPSGGQLALFSELLASRSFLVAAAKRSPLNGVVSNGSSTAVDSALSGVVASTTSSTPGPQLLQVDVKQRTPTLASGLATALVDEFLQNQKASLRLRSDATVAYDSAQSQASAKALALVQDTLRSTPPGTDAATTQALASNVSSAQQDYVETLKVLNKDQAAAANIGNPSVLRIVDEPDHARPASRIKLLAAAVLGGVLVGLGLAAVMAYGLMRAGAGRRQQAPSNGAPGRPSDTARAAGPGSVPIVDEGQVPGEHPSERRPVLAGSTDRGHRAADISAP